MNPDATLLQMFLTHVWQLTLVMLVIGGMAMYFTRSRPHLAYALWLVVLAKAITPPLWTSQLGVFSLAADPPHVITDAWESLSSGDVEHPVSVSYESVAPAADALLVRQETTDQPATTASSGKVAEGLPWGPWLFVWLIGVTALSGLSVLTLWLRERAIRFARRCTDTRLAAVAEQEARALSIQRPVRVAVTANGLGPAMCGVWWPTVLLPECVVADKAPEQWRPILVHELVHYRRGDHLVAALQCLAQIVWWFNPLVWWMNRRICETRERCCDLESVRALEEPPARYAECLLEVLDAKLRLRPVYGFPGVRPVHVTAERVKEIMTMSKSSVSRTPWRHWALALLLALVVLPGLPRSQAISATGDEAEPAKKSASTNPYLLKHGDGKPDGRASIAGAGKMVRFELPGETGLVRAIRVYSSRYGARQPPNEDIEIAILSEDMEVIHTELVPYSLFKRTPKPRWTFVPFDAPFDAPQKFWVRMDFNAERTKGVYVSYDTSTKGELSRVGYSKDDTIKPKFGGDFMVQVVLAKPDSK